MRKSETVKVRDMDEGDVFVWEGEVDDVVHMQVLRLTDREKGLAVVLATTFTDDDESVGSEIEFEFDSEWVRVSDGKSDKGALRRGARRAGKALAPALVDAAYRVAAAKIVKVLIVAARKAARASKSKHAVVAAFDKHVGTEVGRAAVALLAGTVLPFLPVVGQDERAIRLATELLTQGVAAGADVALSGAWSGAYGAVLKALPSIQKTIAALPAAAA